LFLSKRVHVPKQTHVIFKALQLVQGALGIAVPSDPGELNFPIGIPDRDQLEASTEIERIKSPYAILNPGGGWPTKLWSPERFGQLADALWSHFGLESLITHGPGEEQLAQSVIDASRAGKARTVTLSLKGFFALAQHAKIYVGGDTGPTHLAVAANTPIVGLFGPTEWWRNGSPRPADICVERTDIDCRVDCHRRSCSKWICMDIEVERVLKAVETRLSDTFSTSPRSEQEQTRL
jgi:ADP-heptose:LPS heptosyltransferase